jgi:hypothetical protein
MYVEVQRFDVAFLLLIIGASVVIPLALIYFIKPKYIKFIVLFVVAVIWVAMSALLLITKLEISFSPTEVTYQIFPFQRKQKQINWQDVERLQMVKYDAKAFGGRGIKTNKEGTIAYCLKGDDAVLIVLKNKKKVLLGINNPDELNKFLSTHTGIKISD